MDKRWALSGECGPLDGCFGNVQPAAVEPLHALHAGDAISRSGTLFLMLGPPDAACAAFPAAVRGAVGEDTGRYQMNVLIAAVTRLGERLIDPH